MNSRTLHLFTLDSPYELAYPEEFADVGLDSPATAILTDFRAHPPLTLYLDSGIEDARALLANGHTSVVAVVDRDEHFRGLIAHHHLTDEAIMRRVGQGQRRADLQVRDLMVQREALMALDHDSLARTSVGKLLKLLHQEGQPQVLVVDQCGQRIRGLLSARDLAHRLRLPLTIEQQPSFMEIFTAVMH
ncbi:MAG: CBS domain-containing protein [Porticoccaceae bacterium]|nr:CBS domain-containing protein [Pseudomonadota bacterium]